MKQINKIISKENHIYFMSIALLVGINIFYMLLNSFSLNGTGLLGFKEIYDNVHYIAISQQGYTDDKLYAFFPLVPIVISILGVNGMLILNHILSFLNVLLLVYLLKNIYKKTNREIIYIIGIFICSPIQIFAYTLYTEPLFIFLSILTTIIYKEECNAFILGFVVGLSLLVRSFGFALFMSIIICFIIEYLKTNKINKIKAKKIKNKLIVFIFSSCFIGSLYPLFLYCKTGSLFTFVSIQSTYWCRISTNIFSNLIIGFKNTFFCESFENSAFMTQFILFFEYFCWLFLCILFGYKLLIFIKKRNQEPFEILNFLFTILIISGSIRNTENPYCSYYRYYLGCYSFYILFSNLGQSKKPFIKYLFPSILFLSQVVIFIYYFNSYYFY